MRGLVASLVITLLMTITMLCGGVVAVEAAAGLSASAAAPLAVDPGEFASPASTGHGESTHCHPDVKAGPAGQWRLTLSADDDARPIPSSTEGSGIDEPPTIPPPRAAR